MAREFGPRADQHGSRLELRRPSRPVIARADPERVRQITRILLDNALTHTPEGTKVTVTANSVNRRAELTVSDEGPGIPQRVQGRIFERFYTAETGGGSGLGLAIARELAQRMTGPDLDHLEQTLHRLHARPAAGRGPGAVARAADPPRRTREDAHSRARGAAGAGAPRRLRRRVRRRRRAPAATSRLGDRSPRKAPQQVVVETSDNGFDPAQVYREAAPGRGHDPLDLRQRRRRGLRLRARHRRPDRHQRPRRHRRRDRRRRPQAEAKAVYVEFPDRNVVSAKIVGFDPFADVALLEVDPDGLDLHPLKLGDDDDLVVGQPVAAIGSPFGEQHSLSVGIISATDRSVESLTEFQIEGAIQTDASINPGNSGGPLLDADASVIGINQQIETESRRQRRGRLRDPDLGGQALDRAARSKTARPNTPTSASRPRPLYPQLAEKLGLDTDYGGLLAEVVPGGPADEGRAQGRRRQDPLPGLPGTAPAAT